MQEIAEQERSEQPFPWVLLLYPLPFALGLVLRILEPGTHTSWVELSSAFRVARFWQELSARQWAGTDPAGTVMAWAGSLGLALRHLLSGAGWQELAAIQVLDPHNLTHLRLIAPIWLSAALAVAVVNALLTVLLAVLVARIWGARAGLFAGLLLAASPYYLARSRALGPDALTAGLAVSALLALLWGLHDPREWLPFPLSGVLAGLALLNQGLAAIIVPYALLLLLAGHLLHRGPALVALRNVALWVGALVAGAVLPYPGTWAEPSSALPALLAQATSTGWGPMPVNPLTMALRFAPLSLIGLGLLVLRLPVDANRHRLPMLALLAFAVLFWRLIPAGMPDGHQGLTAMVALDVAAAVGLEGVVAATVNLTQRRWQRVALVLNGALSVILLGATGWQAWAIALYRPYYDAYRNPLLATRMPAAATALWSGGLEKAAAYLNTQPDAAGLCVATTDMPALAPFFVGETVPLSESSRLTADFVVLCSRDWQQPDALAGRVLQGQPRQVISVQGIECARVYANEVYMPVVRILNEKAEPDDIVVLDSPSPFASHYGGQVPYEQVKVSSAEQAATRLNELAAGHWRLWHVAFEGADPERILQGLLESQAVLLERQEMPGVTVSTYLLPLEVRFAPLQAGQTLDLQFPGGLRLERAGLADSRVQYRQAIALALQWQTTEPPPANVAISLRLVDSAGRLWNQRDEDIIDTGGARTAAWGGEAGHTSVHSLAVPPAAPPGPYHLKAVFYDAETHQPLLPNGLEVCCRSEVIELLPLEIEPAGVPPAVSELALQHPMQVELASGLELLGSDLGAGEVETGQAMPIRLWWRTTAPLTVTYQAHLILVDAEGTLAGDQVVELAGLPYPATDWTAGEIIEGRYSLPVDPEAAGGEGALGVEVLSPQGPVGEAIRLGSVQVRAVEHVYQPPEIQNPRQETLGQAVRLLGYDLGPSTTAPGQALHLTLYWQCLAPMTTSYTVFTHLLDPQGQMVTGHDGLPASGTRSTAGWLLHEVLTDPHEIVVPAGAPPGSYSIEVGLYDAATWARMQAFDAGGDHLEGDRILLGTVEVTGE